MGKVRAVALALALSLGAVSALPMTAEAASPEIVPTFVPRTDMSFSAGWVTATIYFNWGETVNIAGHSYSSAVLCGIAGAISGGLAALPCLLGFPRIVYGAQYAKNRGVCVALRFVIINPASFYTVTHNGSRCR